MAHFYENLKTVEDYHASKGIEEERYTEVAEASKGDDKAKASEASKGAEGAEAVTADDVKDLVNAAMEGLTDKLKSDILGATKIMSTDDGVEDGGAGGDEKREE